MIVFSDGMKFDTSGALHTERRSDGWYVVGGGALVACADEKAAAAMVKRMRIPRLHCVSCDTVHFTDGSADIGPALTGRCSWCHVVSGRPAGSEPCERCERWTLDVEAVTRHYDEADEFESDLCGACREETY